MYSSYYILKIVLKFLINLHNANYYYTKGEVVDKKELLGKRIKELRRQKGFTQEYLAEKLKIEPRQLSKLETGKHYPSFETILGLLGMFNITFEELVSYNHLDENIDFKKQINIEIENIDNDKAAYIYKIIRCINN